MRSALSLLALCACASRTPTANVAPASWPAPDVPLSDVPPDRPPDAPPDATQARAEGEPLRGVRDFEVNTYGACALLEDQSVQCWEGAEHLWAPAGRVDLNLQAHLGLSPVPGARGTTSMCLSPNVFCALREGGELFCRALLSPSPEAEGETEEPAVLESVIPGLVARVLRSFQGQCVVTLRDGRREVISAPTSPSAPWTHTAFSPVAPDCELSDGVPRCVGRNDYALLANDTAPSYAPASPSNLFGLRGVRGVAFGMSHGCAALEDGTLRCWGRNLHGQLGTGSTRSRAIPTQVPGIDDARAVRAYLHHTCALRASGEVWCWGSAENGLFGRAGLSSSARPVRVPGLDGVSDLRLDYSSACALRRDGTVWCWNFSTLLRAEGPSPVRRRP